MFFIMLLPFPQIFIHLSKKFSSFIIKYIHLVLSKYFVHKLMIFVTNEIFKILFTKGKLIRYYYYFINIYIIY